MIVLITGVAGAGKSTVGRALAARLGYEFVDGDDLHPGANIAKMKTGFPLTDTDRAPWLDAIAQVIRSFNASHKNAVLACSLLKQRYRDRVAAPGTLLVYLHVDRKTAEARARSRHHAFMPASLVASQFIDLEEPTNAIVVDASLPLDTIVAQLIPSLNSNDKPSAG